MKALRSAARRPPEIGRSQERPAHDLAGEDQLEDLPLLVGLGEIDDQRNIGQFGVLVQRKLDQHVEPLLGDPGAVGRLHARPRPAAAALHLAALHREHDIVAARIAADDLHLGAEHAVDHRGNWSVSALAPVPPTVISLVRRSSNLVMPAWHHRRRRR